MLNITKKEFCGKEKGKSEMKGSKMELGLLAIQEPRHYIESNDKIPKQQTQGCRLVTLSTQSKG